MSHLLTDAERPLRRAQPSDDLSIVARARTLTVLPRLDGARKARIVQFLYESGLIVRTRPVLALDSADLSEAFLSRASLSEATLDGANLEEANLSGADLRRANLSGANLEGANLRGVLRLTGEQLEDAGPLKDATMPNGQKYEDWLKDKENRKK